MDTVLSQEMLPERIDRLPENPVIEALITIRDHYERFVCRVNSWETSPPVDFKRWVENQSRDISRWNEVFD